MTDYQTLIDAPTWAFIQKTNASYPENTATLSIADQRVTRDRMCAAFDTPSPANITSHDQPIAGVPCRFAR